MYSDLYSLKRFVKNYWLVKKILTTLCIILWSFARGLWPITNVSNNTRQLSLFLSLSLSRVINICFVKQHSKCGHRYATTRKHTHTYAFCVCNLQTASNSEFHAYRVRALFSIFVHDERGIDFYQMAILSSKEWMWLSHTTHSLTSSTADKIRVSRNDIFARRRFFKAPCFDTCNKTYACNKTIYCCH